MLGFSTSKRDAEQTSEKEPSAEGLSDGPDPFGSGRLRGALSRADSCPQPTTAEGSSGFWFGS